MIVDSFCVPKFKSLAVPFSISSWSKPQQLGWYLTSCMSFFEKLVSLLTYSDPDQHLWGEL